MGFLWKGATREGGVVFERKQAQNMGILQCFMHLEGLACWWDTFLFILAADTDKNQKD